MSKSMRKWQTEELVSLAVERADALDRGDIWTADRLLKVMDAIAVTIRHFNRGKSEDKPAPVPVEVPAEIPILAPDERIKAMWGSILNGQR